MRHTAHHLYFATGEAHPVIQLPDQHGSVRGFDALGNGKTRLAHLPVHVMEDRLDGRNTAHLVERVLEVRVIGVELGEAGNSFRRQRLVEIDEAVER